MLYLHYLLCLKEVLYLLTLYVKIQGNGDFCMKLLPILEHIIKYFAKDNAFFDALHHVCPNLHEANITKDFIAQLKENSKAITKKV